jgi:hypothetical protein
MAFTIDIGYTTDNTFRVNKSVSYIAQGVSIHPLSTVNQVNPIFVIDYDSRFIGANYVRANFLGRKYFCLISVDTAQKMYLSCSVDYLSSFDLSNCDITVTRNEGIGAPTLIPDNKLPVLPNTVDMQYITVNNDLLNENANYYQSKSYVLCVISGGVSYGN